MVIETRSVPPFQKNGYVVACETTGEAIVIDPGDEVHALLEIIDSRSFAVQSILLTHAHIDHVTGVGPARKALDVPVYLHRDDQFLLRRRTSAGGVVWSAMRRAAADRPLLRPGHAVVIR